MISPSFKVTELLYKRVAEVWEKMVCSLLSPNWFFRRDAGTLVQRIARYQLSVRPKCKNLFTYPQFH